MSMFCYQCEQTAKGTGCTSGGVCGKTAETARLQDALTNELVGLARAAERKETFAGADGAVIDGLFTTMTNVSFDDNAILRQIEIVKAEKEKLLPTCGCDFAEEKDFEIADIWDGDDDVRSLKSLLLFGMRGMAAYAHHAAALGKSDAEVNNFFYKGLRAVGGDLSAEELFQLVKELGEANLKCMELLEAANVGAYGKPEPTKASRTVEAGPFIVVSGHDLRDLKLLLEQTEGKGINIYTHGELLPAHGYPELKKHPHLKGNFGTAWQNQQREFENIPAPVLFTTNCIMQVKPTYSDRVFTTSVVSFPGMEHIGEDKNFAPVIKKAVELKGYKEARASSGTDGKPVLTGFGKDAVLSYAEKIIGAVKSGEIKRFFLVGGCDGAKLVRKYYTDFVSKTPKDTVILTLACGKYRFNDLELGEIGGIPRVLDMGQCNDAYGAIQVAAALSNAFGAPINELPLTLVLSWYEQKAIAVLLSLLSLGIKNIHIGPSLPAYLSEGVLKTMVEKFNLTPISTPEADLKRILG